MGFATLVGRYWHTLRHLRPVQLYGRLSFRFSRPQPNLSPAPALRKRLVPWQEPARRLPSMTGERSFLLLNEQGDLAAIGWDGDQREKLWRYHQHYFDDLNAVGTDERRTWHLMLIEDWIANNPPGRGTGWEPYPLSRRIVNWIKWSLSGGNLSPSALHSLAVQTRWLTKRLEFHLLGNHLFTNAKALLFAGLFFKGAEADRWRQTALDILEREIPEQILPDGGHFELSTMYHALAFEDVLDILNVVTCYEGAVPAYESELLRSWLVQRIPAMRRWLKIMCHPDGEISFFNDAAIGVAPSPTELEEYFARCFPDVPPLSLKTVERLSDSGYIRLSYGKAVALLDVARVGPDYLPGHAHADTLSFELSLGAQRVLVNSGTSCYGTGSERRRQRGTAAHNTVELDGRDSSEVWGGFRVARRAYPSGLSIRQISNGCEVVCAHDGYSYLPGKPLHKRIWHMDDISLTVEDCIEGWQRGAEARFHFHPDVKIETIPADARKGTAHLPDGTVLTWLVERGDAQIKRSFWHPRFGESIPSICLVIQLIRGNSSIRFSWFPST